MNDLRERSAGAVIFRTGKDGKRLYLLLHYHFKGDYWDFPRGNIEKGETAEATAKREIAEETGLDDISFITGFKEKVSWFYRLRGQNVFKEAVYFLVETKQKAVKLSEEHLEFKWLDFARAIKTLTYKNSKGVLKKADDFLRKRKSSGIKKFLRQK